MIELAIGASPDALHSWLLKLGVPASVLAALGFAIVYGEKIKTAVLGVASIVNHKILPRYAARKVAQQVTDFVNGHVLSRVTDAPHVQVRVEYAKDAQEVHASPDGAVFVRIREERDQTRNALNTAFVAIPKLFYPHARPYLDPAFSKSVDLQFLRSLARMLGSHAERVFSTDFLQPAAVEEPRVIEIGKVLHRVELGGLFEAILIQELVHLSDHALGDPPGASLFDEVRRFTSWLEWLATREAGDETRPLEFIGTAFRVAVVLTSKTSTRERGTAPYENAARVALARGATSIYILGVRRDEHAFALEVARMCEADPRLDRKKTASVSVTRKNERYTIPLVLFRRNELYASHETFAERIRALDVKPGEVLTGTVHAIDKVVRVDVFGLEGNVLPAEVAWGFSGDPADVLPEGLVADFLVLRVDLDRAAIVLSHKRVYENPWDVGAVPKLGARTTVELAGVTEAGWVARFPSIKLGLRTDLPAPRGASGADATREYPVDASKQPAAGSTLPRNGLYARLPHEEWSWGPSTETGGDGDVPRGEVVARVIECEEEKDRIVVSRREAEVETTWEAARARYRIGSVHRAKVLNVTRDGLIMELSEGIVGRVAAYKVRNLGFELRDFENTVKPGQFYDVVVERSRPGRGTFVLNLARAKPATGAK